MVKHSGTIYLLFVGFVLGILFSLILTIPLINSDMTRYEIISVISSLAMVTIAIVTISFTYLTNKRQRQQWLDDAFVRYEAEKLIEFRSTLGEMMPSYWFFNNELLRPKKYGFIPNESPVLTRTKVIEHFNKLVHLNDLYNANQHIFRKYGLDKQISSFTFYLDMVPILPNKDLEYEQVEQTENSCTYLLENWDELVRMFVVNASLSIDYSEKAKIPSIDELNADLNKNMDAERERLLGILVQRIHELTFKLDELTLHDYSIQSSSLGTPNNKLYHRLEHTETSSS